MINFNFLGKGLGIISPPHFVYDLKKKMVLMLYTINWPNFITWLRLLLEILENMCIVIVCFPSCDFINFEINLLEINQAVFLLDQQVKTKVLNVMRMKRVLKVKQKAFLIIFKKLSDAKNCLNPQSSSLTYF